MANPTTSENQWAVAGRGYMGTALSSGGHLESGHVVVWPESSWLSAVSSAAGSVWSHLLEASSQNCGSLSHGYSLVITVVNFFHLVALSVSTKYVANKCFSFSIAALEKEIKALGFAYQLSLFCPVQHLSCFYIFISLIKIIGSTFSTDKGRQRTWER